MTRVAILGTGMSGFGAAHRLRSEGVDCVLYDKNPYHGGHTISLKYPGGWYFDIGPHVSFTKDERIQDVFAESVGRRVRDPRLRVPATTGRATGSATPPRRTSTACPPTSITKVIADFVEQGAREEEIKNYEDWLRVAYGRSFAEWFPGRYTFKYHTTEARNLTTDWMGPRMYRPSLEEVLRGALAPASPNVHYIQSFRYPKRGGFEAYLASWATRSPARARARGRADRSEGAHALLRERTPRGLRRARLLDPAARAGEARARDAAGRARGGRAPGVLLVRAREPRRRARRPRGAPRSATSTTST